MVEPTIPSGPPSAPITVAVIMISRQQVLLVERAVACDSQWVPVEGRPQTNGGAEDYEATTATAARLVRTVTGATLAESELKFAGAIDLRSRPDVREPAGRLLIFVADKPGLKYHCIRTLQHQWFDWNLLPLPSMRPMDAVWIQLVLAGHEVNGYYVTDPNYSGRDRYKLVVAPGDQ